MIHMGSGGCLFDAVLLSHLLDFENIHWVFIDTSYRMAENAPLDAPVSAWMSYAAEIYHHPLKVQVYKNVDSFIPEMEKAAKSIDKTVLFIEDFETSQKYCGDFRDLAKAVAGFCPNCYFCLDEIYFDSMELSTDEALNFKGTD